MYQRLLSLVGAILLLCPKAMANDVPFSIESQSAVLIEQSSGTILFQQDCDIPLPPASVTKIMTILLVMEALEQGRVTKDEIVVVSANAAAMGGSQVYLKEGETMSLWEMLKCVVVVSANDGSVALAEHLYGSETLFVEEMNRKAEALGMTQTHFVNCTGLPAPDHLTTAYDIALMSRALLENHPSVTELSTIWMDSIRNGAFGLSNTNRLIYTYTGATGLKTGSTDEALYCLSASASRQNLDLIAVILQGPSSEQRFADATALLDYGFHTYVLEEIYPSQALSPIPVILGTKDYLQPVLDSPTSLLLSKQDSQNVTTQINLCDNLEAPIFQEDVIGSFDIYISGVLQTSTPLYAKEDIPRLNLWEIYQNLFQLLVMVA